MTFINPQVTPQVLPQVATPVTSTPPIQAAPTAPPAGWNEPLRQEAIRQGISKQDPATGKWYSPNPAYSFDNPNAPFYTSKPPIPTVTYDIGQNKPQVFVNAQNQIRVVYGESELRDLDRGVWKPYTGEVQWVGKTQAERQAEFGGVRTAAILAEPGTIIGEQALAKKSMLESPTAQFASPEAYSGAVRQYLTTTGAQPGAPELKQATALYGVEGLPGYQTSQEAQRVRIAELTARYGAVTEPSGTPQRFTTFPEKLPGFMTFPEKLPAVTIYDPKYGVMVPASQVPEPSLRNVPELKPAFAKVERVSSYISEQETKLNEFLSPKIKAITQYIPEAPPARYSGFESRLKEFVAGARKGIEEKPVTFIESAALGYATAGISKYAGAIPAVVKTIPGVSKVPVVGKYISVRNIAAAGLTTAYTADVYQRTRAAEVPERKAGEIFATEIVPFGAGVKAFEATPTPKDIKAFIEKPRFRIQEGAIIPGAQRSILIVETKPKPTRQELITETKPVLTTETKSVSIREVRPEELMTSKVSKAELEAPRTLVFEKTQMEHQMAEGVKIKVDPYEPADPEAIAWIESLRKQQKAETAIITKQRTAQAAIILSAQGTRQLTRKEQIPKATLETDQTAITAAILSPKFEPAQTTIQKQKQVPIIYALSAERTAETTIPTERVIPREIAIPRAIPREITRTAPRESIFPTPPQFIPKEEPQLKKAKPPTIPKLRFKPGVETKKAAKVKKRFRPFTEISKIATPSQVLTGGGGKQFKRIKLKIR